MKNYLGVLVFALLSFAASAGAQTLSAPCAYTFGLVAKDTLDFNGNNLYSDSFDSSDGAKSTNGAYDATKRQANGNIAAGRVINSLNVGNQIIYGSILTRPDGTVASLGSGGIIGSFEAPAPTVAAGETAGWIRHDCDLAVQDVTLPAGATNWPNLGNLHTSVTLNSGDYRASSISLNASSRPNILTVNGNARLYVAGTVGVKGLGQIIILPNSSLKVYVLGNVTLAGSALVNQTGLATNACFYGLAASTNWSIGTTDFIGIVDAPAASLSLRTLNGYSGGIVASNIILAGQTSIHYDEVLGRQLSSLFRPCAGPIINDGITTVQLVQSNRLVSFPLALGKSYCVEYCDDLALTNWVPVLTTNTSLCAGEIITVPDSAPTTGPRRFYRLRIQSLLAGN